MDKTSENDDENHVKEVTVGEHSKQDVEQCKSLNGTDCKLLEVDSQSSSSDDTCEEFSVVHGVENVNIAECNVDEVSEIVDVVTVESNKGTKEVIVNDYEQLSTSIDNTSYNLKNEMKNEKTREVEYSANQSETKLVLETSKVTTPYSDHGYCKVSTVESSNFTVQKEITNTQGTSSLKTKQLSLNEDVPTAKKMKLHLSTSQQPIQMSSDIHKQRMDPCPPLTKEHIDLLLSYLSNPKLCVTEQLFIMQLKLSNFPRIKRYSAARQLERWSKYLTKRKIDGRMTLCLRPSEKIILPREKYLTIIRDAHENIGYFLRNKDTRKEKTKRADHNSYHRTFTLIESEYGVGGREFGMSKFSIYEYVANCRECSSHQKRLPSLSKVLGSNEVPKSTAAMSSSNIVDGGFEGVSKGTNSIDYSNDNAMADDADTPISMIWEKPSPGSIWHNQQGLASEVNPYAKLLGVIQEIGLDLISSVQGDVPSKSKFLTKLYCATRLIQEMRTVCERGETTADTQFMIDYLKLQDMYVEMGQLDLFLYDVNLLAIKYRLTKSELFMHIVNGCVSKFNKMNKSTPEQSIFDTPIDLPMELINGSTAGKNSQCSDLTATS